MPNPYPANFLDQLELLDVQHAGDYVALDLGAGGRELPGSGVLAMDLTEGHFLGDCLRLPVRDGCVDLILSQAVLEHVVDPQRAVDEMRRVLKPGGVLYVEAAFMQPVHMAPHHYFNITPHGLAHLLRRFEVEWLTPLGTFGMVLDWLYETAGVPKPPLKFRRQVVEYEAFLKVAYGVSALARKPV